MSISTRRAFTERESASYRSAQGYLVSASVFLETTSCVGAGRGSGNHKLGVREFVLIPIEIAGVAESKTRTAIAVVFMVLIPVLKYDSGAMMTVLNDGGYEPGHSLLQILTRLSFMERKT